MAENPKIDERARSLQRWAAMQAERSSWIEHWRDLGDHFLPRAGRFSRSDRNNGVKKHNNILDNTPIRAVRILGAGMMSGATSPARPWFRLGLPDEDMMEFGPVKEWLSDVQRIMLHVFAKSNTYPMLHQTYEELAVFGSHASLTMDDFDKVIHHYNSPVGEFALASDYKGNVNTVYREFEKTVAELVGEFGYYNCSQTVRTMYDNANYDTWIPVLHIVEPRMEREPGKRNAKNKPWKSCYIEMGRETSSGGYLRESGFDAFPALAPRWSRTGGDIYGGSPAMDCLGDARQLQHEQLRKGNAIDYQTKPPLQLPVSAKGQNKAFLPGSITYFDQTSPSNSARSLFDVNLNLEHLREDIADVRQRINDGMYSSLFLMLASIDKTGMTATEVAERHEEKLIQLGPVMERLHNEELAPLVENTFTRGVSVGIFPPPPPEMQGQPVNIEFISTLAQAQRAVGVNSIDRLVANIGIVAGFKPDVVDKFNADKWVDHYADIMGVDPELIVSDDKVAMVRGQRAQAQAAAAKAEQAAVEAKAAQSLGTVKTNEPNMATDMLSQFSGYSTPQGV